MVEAKAVSKIVSALKTVGEGNFEMVSKILKESTRHKISLNTAAFLIEVIEDKKRVIFKDKEGHTHIGYVKKLNQRYVAVVDEKDERTYNVTPLMITDGSNEAIKRATKLIGDEKPRNRYTRRKLVKRNEDGRIIFGRRSSDTQSEETK